MTTTRVIAATLALAIHGIGFYLFTTGLRDARVPTNPPQRPIELFYVEPKRKPVVQPMLRRRAKAVEAPMSAPITYPTPERPGETPAIDWHGARDAAVASITNPPSAGRSLDSRPKVIELPKKELQRRTGTTQRYDDGEIITWISERCYATNRPHVAEQLDKNKLNVICKDPFGPQTDLFDHLRPDYLGGPTTEAAKKLLAKEPECPTLCGR
jgi:hypothetical protein